MIRHYYTLSKITEELKILTGCKLVECFTQEKNSLELVLYDGSRFFNIHFSADTTFGTIYLRKNFSRARKNTADLFGNILGDVLQDVSIHPYDRIIKLELINHNIYAILFGGAKNNLIVTNKEDIIHCSLKHENKLSNTKFVIKSSQPKSLFEYDKESGLIDALAFSDALLGKYYAEELCYRLEINCKNALSELTEEKLGLIEEKAWELRRECEKSKNCYILQEKEYLSSGLDVNQEFKSDGREMVLSFIPLHSYPVVRAVFDSVSDAVQYRIINTVKTRNFSQASRQLLPRLERQVKKLQTSLAQTKSDNKNTERSGKYKLWAELLIAQPNPKLKHGSKISVLGWDGNSIEIPLDPKLNLHENAAKYFEKARDTKTNALKREKLLPKLEKELAEINEAVNQIKSAQNVKQIEKVKESIKHIPGINMEYEEKEPSQKYRVFELSEDYTLFVGKSAANNDELTMKFAKPNDLWFHARGAAGSHAVLRMDREEKPPKDILRKAAEITAYYSQAKNAKYVPVAYTFKKYVRKPKGANPGSVVLSREEVIMVEPKLPE